MIRLDGKLDDQVTMIVRWGIFGKDEDDLIVLRKFEHQEKIEAETKKPKSTSPGTPQGFKRENYKGLVMAQSRAVEKLNRDIAAAIKEILKKIIARINRKLQ